MDRKNGDKNEDGGDSGSTIYSILLGVCLKWLKVEESYLIMMPFKIFLYTSYTNLSY